MELVLEEVVEGLVEIGIVVAQPYTGILEGQEGRYLDDDIFEL